MAPFQSTQSLKIFVSYSHKDIEYLNQLKAHAAVMRRQGLISDWHDREITAGSNFQNEIWEKLVSCDIFLFLVSSDFLNSYWCVERELTLALEREAGGSMWAIPVIIRPCDWKESEFAHLLALPRDGRPISTWDNEDDAYNDVVLELRRKISGVSTSSSTKYLRKTSETQPKKYLKELGPASNETKRRIEAMGIEIVVSDDFRKFNQLRNEIHNTSIDSPFFGYANLPRTENTSFWTYARDMSTQAVIGIQAFRLDDISLPLNLWAPQFVVEAHRNIGQTMELNDSPDPLSASSKLKGKLVLHGDFWISPKVRNRKLAELFSRFGLLAANDAYHPRAIWSLSSSRMATHGHLIRMGYSTIEEAFLVWKVAAEGIDINEWLAISYPDDLQRLANLILKEASER